MDTTVQTRGDAVERPEPASTRAATTAPSGGRRVWRASRRSLVVLAVFAAMVGLGPLAAAAITLQRGEAWPIPLVLGLIGLGVLAYVWRFGFHPRLVAGTDLVVHNPFRTVAIPWSHLADARPGENGLLLQRTDGTAVPAWCIQTSSRAARRGTDRSVAIVATLVDLARTGGPTPTPTETRSEPPTESPTDERSYAMDAVEDQDEAGDVSASGEVRPTAPVSLRPATRADADPLTTIERDTNLIALAHVFPADRHEYPYEAVRDRWQRLLADPGVEVIVAERAGEPVGFVAYDDDRVRHLGVRPEHGRTGVGTRLLTEATEAMFDNPYCRQITLWVLELNEGARRLYAGQGWSDGEARRNSEFPPHPVEMEMIRRNPRAARRAR